MAFPSIKLSFRGKLATLVTAAVLLPLLSSMVIQSWLFGNQFRSSFQSRLSTELSIMSILMAYSEDELIKGVSRIASDATLQTILAQKMTPQLPDYLTSLRKVTGVDVLCVTDPDKENFIYAGFADYPEIHAGIIRDRVQIVNRGDQVLFYYALPLRKDRKLLGYALGGVNLTRSRFLAFIQEKLENNFAIWVDGKAVETNLRAGLVEELRSAPAADLMTDTSVDGEEYKQMGRTLTMGERKLTFSILLPIGQFRKGVFTALASVASVALMLFFLFNMLLKRSIAQLIAPVTELAAAAAAFERGAAKLPALDCSRNDEFGKMNQSFSDMFFSIRSNLEDIREKNRALGVLNGKIEQQNQELIEVDKLKSGFLANMSHEIRTPLNGVIGFTEELADSELTEDQADMVQTIRRCGESLLSILNDILDFSKIKAGLLEFEELDFDPEMAAYDILGLIHPLVEKKPVELICHIGDRVPQAVKGDPTRFRQVLTNLLGNAAKFTEEGEIELSLHLTEESDTHLKLLVKVRDTGVGIPEGKLESIFETFQQVDVSVTRKFGGTGLGLSICRQISRMMKGDVWAENNSESGTTFYFSAWLAKTEERAAYRTPPVAFSGKRVLVVDNNETNLRLMERMLGTAGMAVTTLRDPDLAPGRLLSSNPPYDICLLEIQMPKISGFTVARNIRASGAPSGAIPLVALSSIARRISSDCKAAGFDGLMGKPIQRQKLLDLMERLLGSPRQIDGCRPGHSESAEGPTAATGSLVNPYSIREERKRAVRILLVDDNSVNLKLTEKMLGRAGYQFKSTRDGHQALEIFMATPERFDLILTDMHMPKMDGLTMTRTIRSKGYFALPIIAMTAAAMERDRKKCIDAGMNDYITKPITREIVYRKVEKWVFATGRVPSETDRPKPQTRFDTGPCDTPKGTPG